MGKIHVLDKSVSNKIAAGEVVSRPASAVKELIENSLDAGAKSITVEIKNGGIGYIRVTDDGSGIEEDDILTAFLPHATSKIHTAEDLYAIGTYGFRGEALASIASVSKLELITKTADAEMGVKILVEGGEYGESECVGAKSGTTITVKELFYNTPARFKFLKKDSAETAAVTDVCQKAALSRPDVSFKYIASGKEVFFTPGDGVLLNAIFAVFGKDFAKNMMPLSYENEGVKVTGYIGSAAVARPNRNMQIFFVNGRSVVSRIMSFALSESYKNQLTVGKFPAAVLNVEIANDKVDVNVHPSKTEVKFIDEKEIYDGIYWGCKNTLYEKPYVPSVTASNERTPDVKIAPEKVETVKERVFIPSVKTETPFKPMIKEEAKAEEKKTGGFTKIEPVKAMDEKITHAAEPSVKYDLTPKAEIKDEKTKEEIQQEMEIPKEADVRVIGQVFETYILAESEGEMLIIDQHAAHERLNYEELKKRRDKNEAESQMLMIPEMVSLSPSEMALWEDNKEFFESIGFETEAMGEKDIMVRCVPTGTEDGDIKDTVIEMLDILSDSKHDKRTFLEERAMYSVSCKSAIKANKSLSLQEQKDLVVRVLALPGINTCPHGRPLCIKLTKDKIEKEFKRI